MEKITSNRSESVRVRLSPEMMIRYEHQASRVGMTPATLAAFIIGAWVKSQEDQLRMQSVAVMDAARKMLPQVDDQQLEALTAGMLEGMAPVLASLAGTTNGQEGGGQ